VRQCVIMITKLLGLHLYRIHYAGGTTILYEWKNCAFLSPPSHRMYALAGIESGNLSD